MKVSDFVTGLIFVVAGIGILVEARSFPAMSGQPYGSAFFPSLIGIAMSFGGLILLGVAIAKKKVVPLIILPDWLKSFRGVGSLIVILVTLVFYMLLVDTLGFCFTAFWMILVMQKWMGAKIIPAIVISFIATAVFYIVFAILLRVPLSHGIVEKFL